MSTECSCAAKTGLGTAPRVTHDVGDIAGAGRPICVGARREVAGHIGNGEGQLSSRERGMRQLTEPEVDTRSGPQATGEAGEDERVPQREPETRGRGGNQTVGIVIMWGAW